MNQSKHALLTLVVTLVALVALVSGVSIGATDPPVRVVGSCER